MAGQPRLLAGAKLRLKRKRPPEQPAREAPGRPPPPPTPRERLQVEDSSSRWFEAEGLSEADRTWLALLKAADPQLNCSALEKVAKFPEFPNKRSQITDPKPEVFNIGSEEFRWEPFPLYRREADTIDHKIPQNLENPTISVIEQEINEGERSDAISPVLKQTSLVANEPTPKASKMGHGIGHSSKDCGKKIKNSPCAHRQNSPRSFAPAAVPKKLSLPELWKRASTQSRQKSARESEKESTSNEDARTQNRTRLVLPSQGSPADTGGGGVEQKPVCQNEDISTLSCCPMCQFRFTGTLSQLDRDSHLAKCLSESTEDVIW